LPLLNEIRQLKYKEYYVDYDDKLNVFNLIQKTTSIESLEDIIGKSVLIEYNVKPYQSKKPFIKQNVEDNIAIKQTKPSKKKKRIKIASDFEDDDS
jgi:hypothetical protein